MRLRRTAAEYICEIEDGDPRIPVIPAFPSAALFEPDPEGRGGGIDALLELLAERGRGLRIVDELTGGAWGFRRSGAGKIAWAAWRRGARVDRSDGDPRGGQQPVVLDLYDGDR